MSLVVVLTSVQPASPSGSMDSQFKACWRTSTWMDYCFLWSASLLECSELPLDTFCFFQVDFFRDTHQGHFQVQWSKYIFYNLTYDYECVKKSMLY